MFRIVVHGGAGFWRRDIKDAKIGVSNAAREGSQVLASGGRALDAVEAAVMVMENELIFNAGKGSALTSAGTVEMDAAIMDGKSLSAGAVALVRHVKNPVKLARLVMDQTDHVLIAGAAAERMARIFHLPTTNPITARRREALERVKAAAIKGRIEWFRKSRLLHEQHPELFEQDTVGAVAVDSEGNFASAASTGGITMKLPGRIGDTPLIGAGLYADNRAGAATVTGWGEVAVKLGLSRVACLMMENGSPASNAAETSIRSASRKLHGQAGMIAIDRKGRLAAIQNTAYMPWSYATESSKGPQTFERGKPVARLR